MKKTPVLLLLFLLLVLPVTAETITGKVVWIYDGDSFLLQDGQYVVEIRLWGIDAPEYGQPCGREATKFLTRLIKGKYLKVEIIDQDSHGRAVGKAYLEDVYLNLELLKNGYAWWYQHYAPKERVFRNAEIVARDQKIGLWREPNPIKPREWREQHPEKGKRKVPQH